MAKLVGRTITGDDDAKYCLYAWRGGVLSIRGVTIRVLYVCASILVFTLLAVVVLGMTVAVPTADVRARQSVRGKDGGQLERQLRERVLL